MTSPDRAPLADAAEKIPQLDGWRGISIAAVLACHLVPLGPKVLRLNEAAGQLGMAVFFVLSGFLITTFLSRRPEARPFLVRRVMRIVPLAWLVSVCTLWLSGAPVEAWLSQLSFLLNYQHDHIGSLNGHYWSLCVEMHFYFGVALLVALGGRRALWVLPVLALLVTGRRVALGIEVTIMTDGRVDEILAGATLALALPWLPNVTFLRKTPPWLWALLLVVCCNPLVSFTQYLRPYAAALAVGSTLVQPTHWLTRRLQHPALNYLAKTSYALYVIHVPLQEGWFSEGDVMTRYLIKRPLTVGLSFLLAHVSTFYYESRFIELARRLTTRRSVPAPPLLADAKENAQ